jgi:hypothetical protein
MSLESKKNGHTICIPFVLAIASAAGDCSAVRFRPTARTPNNQMNKWTRKSINGWPTAIKFTPSELVTLQFHQRIGIAKTPLCSASLHSSSKYFSSFSSKCQAACVAAALRRMAFSRRITCSCLPKWS